MKLSLQVPSVKVALFLLLGSDTVVCRVADEYLQLLGDSCWWSGDGEVVVEDRLYVIRDRAQATRLLRV